MSTRIAIAVLTIAFISLVGSTFYVSLPLWCATPDVGGNHLVQPLCR